MNKVYLSQLWQDTLLSISQKLPLQRDIPSLLRVLKQSCAPLITFERIHLVLPVALRDTLTLYTLEEQKQKFTITETSVEPCAVQRHFWTQSPTHLFTPQTLASEYPEIISLETYTSFHTGYHLPLETQGQCHGSIEFIKTSSDLFSENTLLYFRSLAQTVAHALANINEIQALQRNIQQINLEKENFRVLVDVTNTAIATLEMSDMVTKIADEIERFFGIHHFALALLGANNPRTFQLHTPQQKQHLLTANKLYNLGGSQLQATLQTNCATVLKRQQFSQIAAQDPLLSFILDNPDTQAVCLLPMCFGQTSYGAMLLAHDQSNIFNYNRVELLGQIASRVAIAVHNARNYETIAELKDNLVQENLYLSEQIQSTDTFGEIIGTSPAIKKVLEQVEMVANSDCTVLILGETGSGKELFARAVHNRSRRKDNRMVKMNCAAVPSGLLESELFGHEKGSFTGATTQRKGRFELANQSTLLLDEVGDIPLELQPKLLRVLQEREIERLGGSKVIPVDVRLIAATNRNLKQMVQDNTYRADLFYRLNVFPIIIPPLRERKEDIPLLAQFFTKKLSRQMKRDIQSIPSEALKQLCEHPWPGNVRELANVIERAVILSNGPTLNLQVREVEYHDTTLQQHQQFEPVSSLSPTPSVPLATKPSKPLTYTSLPDETENERDRIIKALNDSNGVVAGPKGAAAKLGIKRTTLLSRMQRMGISVKDVIPMPTENTD